MWIAIAFVSCSKPTESPKVQPAPEKPSASSSAKTALSPSALPVCGKDDPLAALCALGKDASEAKFECKSPEPLVFCAKVDEWCCKYDTMFAGETVPAISYRARFDHQGPKVKDGAILDMKKFKREGPVRGVAIHAKVASDAEGKALTESFAKQLVSWGCREGEKAYRTIFGCGTWQASLGYSDILKQVILEAANAGELECLP
ncbi:MAG: hypothetical protein ACXWUE_37550 [Polyangiales bacterium]